MGAKLRSAAAAVAYAVLGAVVFGAVGIIVGILMDTGAGLEGVLNAAIGGGVGVVLGAAFGAVVYVWGGKAIERQSLEKRGGESEGPTHD